MLKLSIFRVQAANGSNIEKTLTFHFARHTFATTVTLTNGEPIKTVSKHLGHTSIKTTQIYAKVIEKKVSDDMRNLRDILSNKVNNNIGVDVVMGEPGAFPATGNFSEIANRHVKEQYENFLTAFGMQAMLS